MIAIVSLGDVRAEEITPLRPILEDAFGREVVLGGSLPVPQEAFEPQRGQFRAGVFLDRLARARARDWDHVLGVVGADLFAPGLNFVFGEADSRRRVAVMSLHRLRGDETRFDRRAATEAIHELGHAYGLGHCRDPGCVMWFSNTLAETDRKGRSFCRAHARELIRRRLDRAPA